MTENSCIECNQLEQELEELNEKYEAYWYLRSQVSELRNRENNTKCFHHKASQKKRRNEIKNLYDGKGD
ncbi:Acetylornithine aminotransferase [Bienertia sinuspersici]